MYTHSITLSSLHITQTNNIFEAVYPPVCSVHKLSQLPPDSSDWILYSQLPLAGATFQSVAKIALLRPTLTVRTKASGHGDAKKLTFASTGKCSKLSATGKCSKLSTPADLRLHFCSMGLIAGEAPAHQIWPGAGGTSVPLPALPQKFL